MRESFQAELCSLWIFQRIHTRCIFQLYKLQAPKSTHDAMETKHSTYLTCPVVKSIFPHLRFVHKKSKNKARSDAITMVPNKPSATMISGVMALLIRALIELKQKNHIAKKSEEQNLVNYENVLPLLPPPNNSSAIHRTIGELSLYSDWTKISGIHRISGDLQIDAEFDKEEHDCYLQGVGAVAGP